MHKRFVFALAIVVVVSVAARAEEVQTVRCTVNVAKSQFKTSAAPKMQIVSITCCSG